MKKLTITRISNHNTELDSNSGSHPNRKTKGMEIKRERNKRGEILSKLCVHQTPKFTSRDQTKLGYVNDVHSATAHTLNTTPITSHQKNKNKEKAKEFTRRKERKKERSPFNA